jgi:hypothetical protein
MLKVKLSDLVQQRVRQIQITNLKLSQLENKHEKLFSDHKELLQHSAEAWKLVSHLKNDLDAEKQDKAHIQEELNDALAILNKPKKEIETQTDLTWQEIKQMEEDLAKRNANIAIANTRIRVLNSQITQKESEINNLEKQTEDLEPNDTEKLLIEDYWKWYKRLFKLKEVSERKAKVKEKLEIKIEELDGTNWSELRSPYGKIKKILSFLFKEIKEMLIKSDENEILQKQKTELQTKYDLEVKTKKELVEEKAKITTFLNSITNFQTLSEAELKTKIENAKTISFLHELLEEYRKEKFWWDKWMNDTKRFYSHNVSGDVIPLKREDFLRADKELEDYSVVAFLTISARVKKGFPYLGLHESIGVNFNFEGEKEKKESESIPDKWWVVRNMVKAIYQYYRDK